MDRIISATEANQRFSELLREVAEGVSFTVTSRGRPVALQVPHRRGRFLVVSRGLVRRARSAGIQVHVWTIDDPIEMNTLLDRGVDGIMTDRTDILRDVLRARGQWRGDA